TIRSGAFSNVISSPIASVTVTGNAEFSSVSALCWDFSARAASSPASFSGVLLHAANNITEKNKIASIANNVFFTQRPPCVLPKIKNIFTRNEDGSKKDKMTQISLCTFLFLVGLVHKEYRQVSWLMVIAYCTFP